MANYDEYVSKKQLSEAVRDNDERRVVSILKRRRPSLNRRMLSSEDLLMTAVANDNPTIVQELLKIGHETECVDRNGNTALVHAIKNHSPGMVRLLLEFGANASTENTNRKTPLHYAAEHRNLEIINQLIGSGVSVDPRNRWEQTPLHLAVKNNCPDTVMCLLINKADVNAVDNQGNGAVHFAVGLGAEILRLVLVAGADVNLRNKKGETALRILSGRTMPDQNIMNVLLGVGARDDGDELCDGVEAMCM